jgi:arabinofuranan 3-O-arabinosyltransferase
VLGLGALTAYIVAVNLHAGYVPDNRFEQYVTPMKMLRHQLALWDPSRGLGGIREDWWPGAILPIAALRSLGLSAETTEHLWHGALLLFGALGVVALLRQYDGQVWWRHGASGAIYILNPVVVTFLLPSNLFMHYAIAPWLALALVKTARGSRGWRYPALFALLVWAVGDANLPSAVYAAVPGAVLVLHLWLVDRSVATRDLMRCVVRVGSVAALLCLPAIVKTAVGSSVLVDRVAITETPKVVSSTSSWAESWRGMGFWLAYIQDQFGLLRSQLRPLFESPAVVASTFFLPSAALVGAAWTRWRPRIAFLSVLVLSVVLMVGAFGNGARAPMAAAVLWSFEHAGVARGFRTTYKAAPGLMIGVAALIPLAASAVASRFRRISGNLRWLAPVSLGLVVVLAALPLLSGSAYPARGRAGLPPPYWHEAANWLNKHQGPSRALVLPATTATNYRWGNPGDDILDALLTGPHPVATIIPRTGIQSANLLSAMSDAVVDSTYRPGQLAPIARRLGIGFIVLRNDLDWARDGVSRPATFSSLRGDPDLVSVASFGRPGQNVTDGRSEDSQPTSLERALPPVQVFQVRPQPKGGQARQPLILAGDGAAWPDLAGDGILDSTGPVRYAGDAAPHELATLLRAGSPLVVTDTNRRRSTVARSTEVVRSQTLAASDGAKNQGQSLFAREGSQTVADFGDAFGETASSTGTSLSGLQPWLRPANAFDGDPSTAWMGAGLGVAKGAWVRADLRRLATVGEIRVSVAQLAPRDRRVDQASLILSDGYRVPLDLSSGYAFVRFPPRSTRSLTVRIDRVRGLGGAPVGFSDITVAGLDLAETIVVPDDARRAAQIDSGVTAGLRSAPVQYRFRRSVGGGPTAEENAVRRRFWVGASRQFSSAFDVRLGPNVSDRVVDGLFGGPVGGYGTSRAGAVSAARGGLAVDGRIDTGWAAPARPGESLTVRFPARVIDHVEVVSPHRGGRFAPLTAVSVRVGAQVRSAPLVADAACSSGVAGTICADRAFIPLLPQEASSALVTIEQVGGPGSVEILEVYTSYDGNPLPASTLAAAGECVHGLMTVDGNEVGVRLDQSVADLLSGKPALGASCDALILGEGWHDIATGVGVRTSRLDVATGPVMAPASNAIVRVAPTGSAGSRAHVPRSASWLISGQSFDRRWRASVAGKALAEPISLDTLTAWSPPPDGGVATLRYGPERIYRLVVAVGLAGLLLALGLLLIAPRVGGARPVRRRRGTRVRSARWSSLRLVWRPAVSVTMAWVFAGAPGGLAMLGAWVAGIERRPIKMLLASAALLSLAGVATVLPLSRLVQTGRFVTTHRLAADLGAAAGGLALVAAAGLWLDLRVDEEKGVE